MSFIIKGIDGKDFQHLYGLSEQELKKYNAISVKINRYPAYPDRITLKHIPLDQYGILINHTYLDSKSPYRGSHAIFIWEGQIKPTILYNELPDVMYNRVISLRAFDEQDMMIDSALASSDAIRKHILNMFSNKNIQYILAYNAKQGCFSCRITPQLNINKNPIEQILSGFC